ncbi:heavy-metal-associated domain-containing protein [Nocardiopsis synnemataformans]|uniref:heavy-metal-associated domain-containing protein n=1 Tax=Nocardiopsis synnemataformans TaxID=61305 RepID=UPI003EBC753D
MCGTCSTDATPAVTTVAADARVYQIEGMTCGHCVSSVSTEVSRIPGVTGVAVDLAKGRVTVGGSGFTDESVRAAVDEAGYQVASV